MSYPRLLCHFVPKWANYVINEVAKLIIDHYWAILGSYAILPKWANNVINELAKLSIDHYWAILGSYAILAN